MLEFDNINVDFVCQGYRATNFGMSPDKKQSALFFKSERITEEVKCPICGGRANIHESYNTHLKDTPILYGVEHRLVFFGNRYKCVDCGKTFAEKTPLCHPGTRITDRAANWIKGMLKNKVSIRSIQELTGIHWETIRKVQIEYMQMALDERSLKLKREKYKPRLLAVDEFAIHKGHSYATSVMDLETGEVIWVGKGRALADFEKFFEETDLYSLSNVIAVAMDMNASYNKLVSKYLPQAEIVYDRYHMQAQFGKEVLGVVRLEEARKHKERAKEILDEIKPDTDKAERKEFKNKAKQEKHAYSQLKKSRWTLLRNSENLTDKSKANLENILSEHQNLAVCYAMKEEMNRLFGFTDSQESEKGWNNWFNAAKESDIPALVKFAQIKEKRLPGLIAHATYQISTGKLEGFNNKIKVAKRIGYGYRDDDYFFMLVKFISLPSIRSHTFP